MILAGAYVVFYLTIVVVFFRLTEPLVLGWSLMRDMLPGRLLHEEGSQLARGSQPDTVGRTVGVE